MSKKETAMKPFLMRLAKPLLKIFSSFFAQTSGATGNCTWTHSLYTLTISGKGAMADYDNQDDIPWKSCKLKIKRVIVEPGVTRIGERAFCGCSGLVSVSIPNSVTDIGDLVFCGCSGLVSVSIPNSVTSIGDWVFYGCSGLVSVSIPNSVTSIGKLSFAWCESLDEIAVESGNPNYSSLNGVLFNKDKSTLVVYPFGKNRNYDIPRSVISIGAWAFAYFNKLISVIILPHVTGIERGAFYSCDKLAKITISGGVTDIGDWAFGICRSLTEITIPSSATSIGDWAFTWCESLSEITNLNPEPQHIASNVFEGVHLSRATLSVPAESVEAYRRAPVWQDFGKIMAIESFDEEKPATVASVEEISIVHLSKGAYFVTIQTFVQSINK